MFQPVIMLPNEMNCPWCGEVFDAADCFSDRHTPDPGDISLCAYCGMWAVFEGKGQRRPTADELIEISELPDCQACMAQFLAEGPLLSRHRRKP